MPRIRFTLAFVRVFMSVLLFIGSTAPQAAAAGKNDSPVAGKTRTVGLPKVEPASFDPTGAPTPTATATATPTATATATPTAQPNVVVSGSTGANGGYATLRTAFAALNANTTQTGNTISVLIFGDTNEGTTSASLNQPTGGSWTTLTVNPMGARTVTGATTAGTPLINLAGADNVTINGLNAGGNSLTISNTTASATAGTSTIRLINGARNNTVTNCTVLGSSTSANGAAGGNILISSSTSGANSGNTISNNNLGPAGANLPSKCFFSLGSASPNNNTGTVIDNNNVFDFFDPSATCAGIRISANTDTTTISNNRIYQTAPRTFTTTGQRYNGIQFSPGAAGSAVITGNTVGFGAPNGTGTTTISGLGNLIAGIQVTDASASVTTSIQGNTISGITQTTNAAGASTNAPFIGISVGLGGGSFNIGGTTGNTIGSLDGSSGIVINNSTVTSHSQGFVGIVDISLQDLDVISNNNIGTVTINDGGTGTGAGFRGIQLGGTGSQNVTISNNTIGGTASGSITDNVVGTYSMVGIDHNSANLTATGNVIRNITSNSQASGIINISGIIFNAVPTGASTVSRNTIHSLTDNAGAASGAVYGIVANFPTAANVVERNFVHSLSVNSTDLTSQLTGILVLGGSGTYRNNMVRLGIDASGASITPGFSIYGIFESAGSNSILANTIYVGGTNVVSSNGTYALVSNVTTGTRNYVDNIFWNARSNASGIGKNYGISLASTTGLTSNFNDLLATGTGGVLGQFGGDRTTLAAWRTATGLDANSVSVNPQLIAPNGTSATLNLHLTSDASPVANLATPVAGVTNDFDNDSRSATTPDIGADEVTAPATPTPTPTATATATATATSTPAPTATSTATATATPVATATATPTATATVAPTATATATPAPTATATATPIPTATATVTPAPTSTPTPAPSPGQPLNISTRLRVETGDLVMIAGFIIHGYTAKPVILRGMGPSLANAGIPAGTVLNDPVLELRGSDGGLITSNDDWKDSPQRGQIEGSIFQPGDDREAVIVATLNPGAYTAILTGEGQTTGVSLVEVCDNSQVVDAQLANISTRGFVQTGNDVMIGGFILGGNPNNTRVALRGIGPSLAQFGLNPVLADPILELYDSNGTTLVTNDDWQSDPASAAQLAAAGLGLSNSSESGIFTSLPPGAFTAILAGKDGGIGIGLVELYDLR